MTGGVIASVHCGTFIVISSRGAPAMKRFMHY